MRMNIVIAVTGVAMFVVGLILFYSIELGQTDTTLRFIKNVGTFVGISGMGVCLAGILLYLINKNDSHVRKSLDV